MGCQVKGDLSRRRWHHCPQTPREAGGAGAKSTCASPAAGQSLRWALLQMRQVEVWPTAAATHVDFRSALSSEGIFLPGPLFPRLRFCLANYLPFHTYHSSVGDEGCTGTGVTRVTQSAESCASPRPASFPPASTLPAACVRVALSPRVRGSSGLDQGLHQRVYTELRGPQGLPGQVWF